MQVPSGFQQPVQDQVDSCLNFVILLDAWQRAQLALIPRLTRQHCFSFPMQLQQAEQIRFHPPPSFSPCKAVSLPS